VSPLYFRIDRYVFMHRTNNNEHLTVKIRSPIACVNRFELVGKDLKSNDERNDYDWIVIYKIIFRCVYVVSLQSQA